MSDWLVIYLLGVALAIMLMIIQVLISLAVGWLSKGNVLRKNLKKLEAPESMTFWGRCGVWLVSALFSAALSWIQVLINLFTIPWTLFSVLREIFTSVPEEIKQLRFPLYNNPQMSREAVWAYVRAIDVKAGAMQPSAMDLVYSLEAVTDSYPNFDQAVALNCLKSLNAVDAESIANAIEHINAQKIEN